MLSVDFVRRRKALFLGLLLVILGQWQAYGQGCSCPPVTTCGCTVGLTKMTVQFNGLLGLTVDVQDGGGNIFSGLLLLPGSTFTVQSSAGAGNPFVGDQVTIRTTLVVLANINTSCTNQVKIGTTFGNFTVTGGESVGGQPICCLNMESSPPNFTFCPPNVDVAADANACGTNVTWPLPTVTDNCGVASVIPDHNRGDFFPVGQTVVRYTATDNYGNTANCAFNVRVRDQTGPVFAGCPANFSVPADPGSCTAVVNWTAPTSTDNCEGAIVPTSPIAPGTTLGLGAHTITYSAQDSQGNKTTCSFIVTVTDSQPPVFAGCPTDFSVPSLPGTCSAVVTWTAPTATDNCGGVIVPTSPNASGASYGVGAHTITYTANDGRGNQSTCSFTVTVTDNEAPVLAGCPTDFSVPADAASCNAIVTWTAPTATDNCAGALIPTSPDAPGSSFGLGPHTITYTADDGNGHQSTCSFVVTVVDATPPVFAGCPTDFSVSADAVSCKAVVTWTAPTANDNCAGAIVPTSPDVSGSSFGLGPHTITYTANDGNGNQSTCSFVVTVTDNTPPVFAGCPTDFSVSANALTCNAIVTWTAPTANDNCAGAIVPTSPDVSGSSFGLGPHTITYTANDGNGNQSTCSFVVTVTDNTPPVLAGCPTDFSVSADAATCNAIVTWTAPTANDNCAGAIVPTSPDASGSSFGLGPHTITYTADDGNGNASTCSFVVTVVDNTAPVFAGCPTDFSVSADAASCNAIVTWTAPTANDNCAGAIVPTSPDASGSSFGLGPHTITYTANDGNGNQSTCSFVITVVDDTAPVFAGCPTDFSVSADAASCNAIVTWAAPTASDNCAGAIVPTSPDASGSTFGLGPHTITYTANDGNGNQSTCSFVVTVTDNTPPVFAGCPTDFSVSADALTCNAIVTWTAPTANDNCAGAIVPTSPDASGSSFGLGPHTITYTANDGNGNVSTCSFVVTVTDNTPPVLAGCPTDFSVSADAASCSAIVTWTAPTANDNCAGAIVPTSPDASGSSFGLGAHTITYTADDGNGNISTCSFIVTVTDNTAPVFAGCPTDFSVSADAASCNAIVTWTAPTANDNCAGAIVPTSPDASGATFGLGPHTITYTANDGNGNQSTCSFVVTVVDDTAPVFAGCPTDFSVSADAATCNAIVTWTAPTANDNCSGAIFPTSPDASGSSFGLGPHTITYTADDGNGNVSTCSFIVTVTDNTAPVFAGCPTDFSVSADALTCNAIVTWTAPTANDNCAGAIVPTSPDASGSSYGLGPHTITYTADDGNGNVSTCSFIVTVTDNTAPVFAGCPTDFSVSADAVTCDAVVNWTLPTANDNCAGAIIPTSPDAPGTTYALGPHTITYTADDGNGNVSTCSFVVTVVDDTAPVFAGCPTDFSVSADPLTCNAIVTWTAPTASDNCAGAIVPTSPDAPGATFALGAHTITYTADDGRGNQSTCSFVVTVVDNTPPVFAACPTDFSVAADAATCNTIVVWTPPTATDNCAGAIIPTSPDAPGATFALGAHTITYTADDGNGNLSTCSFVVTVVDNTLPVLTGCPTDFSVSADAVSCNAIVTWTPPTASDNCAGAIIPTSPDAPGATFALGPHTITYTADDGHGNQNTCSFVVTVVDNTAPVFSGCPTDFSVSADASVCSAVVTWTPPTANDNCAGAIIPTSLDAPGGIFALGPHTITYTADDGHGNQSTCSFVVTVTDNTAPVFAGCPADFSVSADAATCNTVVTWTPPTANDNCAGAIIPTSLDAPGATFALGPHTITYTAADGNGNQSTCSFVITVVDDTAPVFAGCPTDFSVSADPVSCGAVVTWTPPTANDNCAGALTPTSPDAPGTTFALGAHTITYTADDGHGNLSTCSFVVTITDDTPPVLAGCPTDFSVPVDPASCSANVTWTAPTATDNCAGAIIPTSPDAPGVTFALGAHTITYTADDGHGNQSACSFVVTVVDNTAPVFAGCPTDFSIPADPSTCGAIATWTPPTASDNCAGVIIPTSPDAPGATFSPGAHTITYTADDGHGNLNTCSFVITVVDDTKPVFTSCPANIAAPTNATSCTAVVTWVLPTVTDNCDATPVLSSNFNSGDAFTVGVHTVTYEATDAAGNKETCSFTVTVEDHINPTFAGCPSNIVAPASATSCDATVSWVVPTASDNCTATPAVTSNFNSGDVFPIGVTTVTYTATDAAGNSVTCSFSVTVNDNRAPVFTGCPAAITLAADASCQAVATWTPPVVKDNCSFTLTNNHNPGETFPLGTTPVIYTATDPAGNVATCSFNVIVRDAIAPVFSNCPVDFTVAEGAGCGLNVNWIAPTVTDNCTGTLTLTSDHAPGEFFAVGTTTITYTATDVAGNVATCSFAVTVEDITPPAFQNCPPQISVAADNSCGAIVNWVPPTASDNCSVSVVSTHQPGDRFDIGVTEVAYTATDIYGNASICHFNVTVRNEELPTFAGCPSDVHARCGESGEVTVSWDPPTATTRCGELSLTSSHEPGETFSVGTTPVVYTAANDAGKTITCNFNVIVDYEELEIEVTKVVTPDGDGQNDDWIVVNIEKFARNKVLVLDRWGSVIYQASGYNNSTMVWNGVSSNGVQVPTGTYYYVIEVDFLHKHLKKSGFIELLR
jgi:gliding motility-associated-like protein